MKNLRQAIAAATTEPDLDKALVPIQEALGQDDGGIASVFFSGPNGDNWETMTPAERSELLLDYVASEVTHMGLDDEPDQAVNAAEPRDNHDAEDIQDQNPMRSADGRIGGEY